MGSAVNRSGPTNLTTVQASGRIPFLNRRVAGLDLREERVEQAREPDRVDDDLVAYREPEHGVSGRYLIVLLAARITTVSLHRVGDHRPR